MIASFKQVKEMAERGNVIPLYQRIPADLDTPVSTFLRLAKNKKNAFLLESIEGGEKLARYSFIGFDPFLLVQVDAPMSQTAPGAEREIILTRGNRKLRLKGHPPDVIASLSAEFKPVRIEGIPRFSGGGVGYFSYDTIRWFEKIPDCNKDVVGMPDCLLGYYQSLVVFDHLRQEIILIANILLDEGSGSLRQKYQNARKWVEDQRRALGVGLRNVQQVDLSLIGRGGMRSLDERKDFERNVRRAKRYIREGDIFQVVLSRRWKAKVDCRAVDIYRRLRRINPSPYMFLLKFGANAIIGSSPEMLARVEGGKIETRPIAGTRPRGKDEAEDQKYADDLSQDAKELAEHTMLLDLGRNDIGRVSIPGSVSAPRTMEIEKYSHVMHLVSAVEGKIKPEISALEGMFSCAPAGTVSGAPKIRAMEIIDELEQWRRGPYAGTVAYLDFWGNLDSCIAIRTIVKNARDIYIQAGAGIVADSVPAREASETEHKAQVLFQALTGSSSSKKRGAR